MEEKTCGNCNEYNNGSMCRVKHRMTDMACDDWTINYPDLMAENELLKSQLSRYRTHPFDVEKRETWPPFNQEVVAWNSKNNKKRIVMLREYWTAHEPKSWEYSDGETIDSWHLKAFDSWSYLPGEDG